MTPVRAAAYVGSAIVMGWLASATAVPQQPAAPRMPKASADGQTLGAIASDVQAQASRLRQRLAAAPAPQPAVRNPFQFGSHEIPKRRGPVHVQPAPADTAPDLLAAEPPLALIGVAEQKTPVGLIRTAMIGGVDGQFVMVTEGQEIGDRYKVNAVGPDSVELKDLTTGALRRLVMK